MSRRLTDGQRELVEQNLGLAYFWAQKYFCRARDYSDERDFEQASFLGLCEAALLFDPARGFSFGTYSQYHCRRRILMAMRDRDLIRIPAAQKYRKIHIRGATRLGEMPDRTPGPLEHAVIQEVFDAISTLPEKERFILEQCREGRSMADIARELSISRERVRQIRDKAIDKLQKRFKVAA